MTVIAAIYDKPNKRILLGSDSWAVYNDLTIDIGPKMVSLSPSIIAGYCGTFLIQKWLQDPPKGLTKLLNDKSISMDIKMNRLSDMWLQESKVETNSIISSEKNTGQLLIITDQGIYRTETSGFCLKIQGLFTALGCGENFCLGAMHEASRDITMPKIDILRHGLEAACQLSHRCGGNIHIRTVSYEV